MEITTNKICENCGCIIEETDDFHFANGERLCDDCFYENFVYCEICGEVESIPDATYIYNVANVGNVCSSCLDSSFIVCYHCGEYVRNCDTLELANGHLICDNCYKEQYFTCNRCGEVFHLDNREYIEGEGDLCPECAEQFAVIVDYKKMNLKTHMKEGFFMNLQKLIEIAKELNTEYDRGILNVSNTYVNCERTPSIHMSASAFFDRFKHEDYEMHPTGNPEKGYTTKVSIMVDGVYIFCII